MNNEDKILEYSSNIAEAVASMHFHETGLLDDQVPYEMWSEYSDSVRNAILDCVSRMI